MDWVTNRWTGVVLNLMSLVAIVVWMVVPRLPTLTVYDYTLITFVLAPLSALLALGIPASSKPLLFVAIVCNVAVLVESIPFVASGLSKTSDLAWVVPNTSVFVAIPAITVLLCALRWPGRTRPRVDR